MSPLSDQHLQVPEMPSARPSCARRWAPLPASLPRLHNAPGGERRVLLAGFASGLGSLLFAIIISDLLERSGTEVWGLRGGGGGWVDGQRRSSRCCSIGPHHGTAELGRIVLQIRGEKGPTPFPYGKEQAASPTSGAGQGWQRHPTALRRGLLSGMPGVFLGTASARHRERREGLAEAAGLAQLCGFQRCLIDSFFLTLPHSPDPHMHFSC